MWCLTETECISWAKKYHSSREAIRDSQPTEKHEIVVTLSTIGWSQLSWFSDFVASSLCDYDECLLWVTQTGVWRENLNIFYRVRETYRERRRVEDAPGHLFLKSEGGDLAMFIQLALLNTWDFELLTNFNYFRSRASHDGFLHLLTDDDRLAEGAKTSLDGAKIEYRLWEH